MMMFTPSRHLVLCSFLLLPLAKAAPFQEADLFTRSSGIQWGPCEDSFEKLKLAGGYNGTINCANLTVPLDYTNKSANATIDLNLLRVPVPQGKSKGALQFNFGGPGVSGRPQLASSVALWQTVSGHAYDMVAFDPRGTGNVMPYSCYNNATEQALAYQFDYNVNTSDAAVGETWVRAGNTAGACATNLKFGPYVGTAATARDFMSVVDALGEDGLLHYYGGSYGTVLGATLAAMFPDRIGHMIVDAVIDAQEYYHDPAEAEYISLGDQTWTGFFSGCVAFPENCAIAGGNKSAAQLEAEFYDWLYELKYLPLGDGYGNQIRYADVKSSVRETLYSPVGWGNFSVALKALYEANVTLATALLGLGGGLTEGPTVSAVEANMGIRGADRTVRVQTLAEMEPYIVKILASSQISGDISAYAQMATAQWKSRAVEVYGGDFKVKTKNPVLVASNSFDPLAPLSAAQRLTGLLEGSSLVINNGYGHSVLSQASICTIKHIREYLVADTLPANNTLCEPDIPLFSTNITLADVLIAVEAEYAN